MRAARILAACLLLAATCQTNDEGSPKMGSARARGNLSHRLQSAVKVSGIREHLEELQAIADANEGTRVSGTRGYDESARYVADRLRAAGYEVRFQEFVFPAWEEQSPPDLVINGRRNVDQGDDFITMMFSPPGAARGVVTPVDLDVASSSPTSGCDSSDFEDFPGGIALMIRSNCFFRDQAANAEAAGAVGALIMPTRADAAQGVLRGTLTADVTADLPVMGISYSLGRRLIRAATENAAVEMIVDSSKDDHTTSNVIAESPSGDSSRVVMLGGHLDSVPFGPGINDNGSGIASILEIAEELAPLRPASQVRFAFWGAEEFGLLGSVHYVQSLTDDEIRSMDAYLNFDMLGSSNFVRFVYDGRRAGSSDSGGSVAIQELFQEHFDDRELPSKLVPLEDRSDHAAFAAAGIDIGGLFSGADEIKSGAEARDYGGQAGELHDPCYHLPCDTIEQVNFEILDQMADAAADVLISLAGAR